MARHGAHHSAQKSTSTGTWLWRTADSQVLSVTSRELLMGGAICVGAICVGFRVVEGRGNMALPSLEIHSAIDGRRRRSPVGPPWPIIRGLGFPPRKPH